jgi:hypothetical protein
MRTARNAPGVLPRVEPSASPRVVDNFPWSLEAKQVGLLTISPGPSKPQTTSLFSRVPHRLPQNYSGGPIAIGWHLVVVVEPIVTGYESVITWVTNTNQYMINPLDKLGTLLWKIPTVYR